MTYGTSNSTPVTTSAYDPSQQRIRPTRAGLFAIELLVAVGVFIFCATVCVGVFIRAEVTSRQNQQLAVAVNTARDVAECFKASMGDLEDTASLCGGSVADGRLTVELSDDMLLLLTATPGDGYTAGDLSVACDGDMLLHWEIAALSP